MHLWKTIRIFLRGTAPNGLRLEIGIHMKRSEVNIKCISLLATLLSQWDDIKSDMLASGPLHEVFFIRKLGVQRDTLLLTAYSTRGSTTCTMKICINRCKQVEDFLVLQGNFCSSTQFCKRDFRTPTWVYNAIGLHGS
jgi:hypothetical protein